MTAAATAPAAPVATRPRIVVAGPLPPPIGGVETVTQTLLESDALGGFDVRHCDTTKGRPKQTQGRFDAGNTVWALRHLARMRRAVADRPALVYLPVAGTWSGFVRDLALAWVARRSGARVVGHIHGSDFQQILEARGVRGRLARRGLAGFDRLLVLGERWRALLASHGIRTPVAIVPSTLRREVFERGAAFVRTPRRDSAVEGLMVGQVGRRKGVFDVLEALRTLKQRGVPFRMTFVGPDEYEGEWQRLMAAREALGVADVATFTGPLQGEALYEQFRRADVFVMPSYNEGLPVVFHEAGAFAIPVITTPVGAIPDLIVHERNGLLVAPADVPALVAAIERTVADPAWRERLGARLREDVAAFHPDRVSARVADELRAALAGG